eukprot:g3584.t1
MGEDLLDNDAMRNDYRPIPELDRYDDRDLDNQSDVSEISFDGKAAAEAIMHERDRREHRFDPRRGRLPAALRQLYEDGDGADEADDDTTTTEEARQRSRRRRMQEDAAHGTYFGDESQDFGRGGAEADSEAPFSAAAAHLSAHHEGPPINLSEMQGFVKDWILAEAPRREVARRFRQFLNETHDEKMQLIYRDRIQHMCTANRQSLEVDYTHISARLPQVAIWLADAPREILDIFDEVAKEEVLRQYPNYEDTHRTIHVRITDLPICDSIRDLRQYHTNAFVKIKGVVTRRTGVFPQLSLTKYECAKCSFILGPFAQSDGGGGPIKIGSCPECQSKGPFHLNREQTVYRNYQKISLQESPGTVPAGRVPRYKQIILTNDLIDAARPGEEIEVTGIYVNNFDVGLNVKQGFPVFSTLMEANYIMRKDNQDVNVALTDQDRAEIHALSQDPRIGERIIRSIAPSIYGQETVKTAVAMALFSGREKNVNKKHRIRGDINVLLLGDPGTAKSQVLKYIEQTAPRAVYTTGKGASAVGLTAAVHKDPVTGEWTLEGGALVLADRGVCMIDEFDKMNDADRTSIHEAMEQQSISISKAGIVTTLQARCAVIAAANPIGGRYDASRTLAENVELTDPILQRFDILCVVRDRVDPVADERLARFVTGSHMNSKPYEEGDSDDSEADDSEADDSDEEDSDDEDAKDRAAVASDESFSTPTKEKENSPNRGGGGGAGVHNKNAKKNLPFGNKNRPKDAEKKRGGNDEEVPENAKGTTITKGAASSSDPEAAEKEEDDLKIIPQDLLKKYIWFARTQCRPSLHDVNKDKIVALYTELRQQSARSGGVPIAVRHIESIIRISEAHARMHLRDHVREDDVDVAIRVMLESFISAQKHAVMKPMRVRFRKYLEYKRGMTTLLMHLLEEMLRDARVQQSRLDAESGDFVASDVLRVSLEDFSERANELQIFTKQTDEFFKTADFRRGFRLNRRAKVIEKAF